MTLDTELALGPSGKLEMLRGLCCLTETAGHLGILLEVEETDVEADGRGAGGFEARLISSADLGEISDLGFGLKLLLRMDTGDGIWGGETEGLVTEDIVLDTGL